MRHRTFTISILRLSVRILGYVGLHNSFIMISFALRMGGEIYCCNFP